MSGVCLQRLKRENKKGTHMALHYNTEKPPIKHSFCKDISIVGVQGGFSETDMEI